MLEITGRRLGQYLILEQIGKGGMATVFKAEQTSLGRVVAVKVLPVNFQNDETFRERFVQEARAVARLNHPYILPVYDYGETEAVAYIVMEYVSGGTLQSKMGAPLRLDYTAKIVGQIGSALDYAHDCGVIHRDVKPSNIMLRGDGTSLLADFGLAKLTESSRQLTHSGIGVGTPDYMSPEQGEGARVDGRADLYSLGVVMYEMLTGRVPFTAETPVAVVVKHISESPPRACASNPHLPRAVDVIVLKALAKRPEDRYQKGSDLADALAQIPNGDLRLSQGTASPALPAPLAPPGLPALPPDRRPLRRYAQAATVYGGPVTLMLVLVFGPMHMALLAALPLSAVALLGLYLIFPPGPPEDPNRKDVRRLLQQCLASSAHIRVAAAGIHNPKARGAVERITGRSEGVVRQAVAAEGMPLSDANRLAGLLALIAQIVDSCVKIDGGAPGSGAAQMMDALRLSEGALDGWAERGVAADIAQLEIVMALLENISRTEGFERNKRGKHQ